MKIAIFTGTATAPFMLQVGASLSESNEVVFIPYNRIVEALIRKNGRACHAPPTRGSIAVGASEIKHYSSYYQRDLSAGRDSHLPFNLESYLTRRCINTEKWLDRLFKEESIQGAVFYNGAYYLEQIAKKCAKTAGITTAFIENGMYPDTAHVDSQGTNAYSEVMTLDSSMWSTVSPEQADDFVRKKAASLVAWSNSPAKSSTLTVTPLAPAEKAIAILRSGFRDFPQTAPEIMMTIARKAAAAFGRRPRVPIMLQQNLPANFAFLPLQVTHDSQFHAHSDWIKTPQQSIAETYKALKAACPDIHLVVKPHPAESPNVSFDAILENFRDIVWVKDIPLTRLIEQSSLVINVNSSVGFQALLFKKPVICLGRSLYAGNQLAKAVGNATTLEEAIRDFQKNGAQIDVRFFPWFFQRYCCRYHRSGPDDAEITEIAAKVLECLNRKPSGQ